MVGIQWADAFIKGNTLGMALGMALGSAGQSAIGGFGTGGIWTDAGEHTLAYELWYKFQVTDNISVTPAFFWIQNDAGALGSLSGDDTFGGLIKTTFKFWSSEHTAPDYSPTSGPFLLHFSTQSLIGSAFNCFRESIRISSPFT